MSWLRKFFGEPENNQPFEASIEYLDGTKGAIPVWATGMRDAMSQVVRLMPEHYAVRRLSIVSRQLDQRLHPRVPLTKLKERVIGHCGSCNGTEFHLIEKCVTCGETEILERYRGNGETGGA